MTYKIAITRRFRWRKLCSGKACGALTEWLVVVSTLGALAFLASIPKIRDELRRELRGHVATTVFMATLMLLTVGMTLLTMRKLAGRLEKETTEICELEV